MKEGEGTRKASGDFAKVMDTRETRVLGMVEALGQFETVA
jgi:hypothetical protein